jgi:hypothetical protein
LIIAIQKIAYILSLIEKSEYFTIEYIIFVRKK